MTHEKNKHLDREIKLLNKLLHAYKSKNLELIKGAMGPGLESWKTFGLKSPIRAG